MSTPNLAALLRSTPSLIVAHYQGFHHIGVFHCNRLLPLQTISNPPAAEEGLHVLFAN
jgi:hypothetical protein